MPVSCTVSRKKVKNRTQIICDSMEKVITDSKASLKKHSEIKDNIEYEPGLLKKAIDSGLIGDKESVSQFMLEHKRWKQSIRSDVKADVMAEKQKIKQERKLKRQNRGEALGKRRVPQKRRRSPGKFI